MRLEKLGTSSVIYRIGLFQGESDEAAAEGRFVHVYVSGPDREVTPIPGAIRAAVEPLADAARLNAVRPVPQAEPGSCPL